MAQLVAWGQDDGGRSSCFLRKVLVSAQAGQTIKVLLYLDQKLSPGTETDVRWYERARLHGRDGLSALEGHVGRRSLSIGSQLLVGEGDDLGRACCSLPSMDDLGRACCSLPSMSDVDHRCRPVKQRLWPSRDSMMRRAGWSS